MTLPPAPQRTTPAFSFSLVERSLRDSIARREFGKNQMQLLAAFFDHTCAYCGGSVQRWDHLIPVSMGGDTVLGNMVPACSKCDDSKRGLAYDAWAFGPSPGSPEARGVPDIRERISRIREYVDRYGYVARTPEELLSLDELAEYHRIRQALAVLRADCDRLFAAFRRRSGSR